MNQHDQDKLFEHTRRLRNVGTVESERDETRPRQAPHRQVLSQQAPFTSVRSPPLPDALYGSQQALAPTAMRFHERLESPSGPIDFSDEERYDSDESDEEATSESLNEEEAARAVEELLGKYTTLFQQPQHAEEEEQQQHVEQASPAAGADQKSQERPRRWSGFT